MKTIRNQKGITLVEMILAACLVAIVAGAAYSVITTGVRTFNNNIASADTQSGLRTAMMKITKLEHNATGVSATANSVTFTLSGGTHVITASGNELKDNGTAIAKNITTLSTTSSGKMLSVTLSVTRKDGSSEALTTQFYID